MRISDWSSDVCSSDLMADAGLGVWSLVAQFMIAAAVSTGLLWLNGSWQPSLAFSTQSFRRMFGFGSKLTLESTLKVLYEISYVLFIGRIFSAEVTGLFYFAKSIRDMVVDQLNSAVPTETYLAMAHFTLDVGDLLRNYQ